MEYSVAQELKEKGGVAEVESSDVTPQKLLDMEYFAEKRME